MTTSRYSAAVPIVLNPEAVGDPTQTPTVRVQLFAGNAVEPIYDGQFEPRYPCRVMATRHCPAVYDDVCGDRPCARYESRDGAPWIPEFLGLDASLAACYVEQLEQP